MKYAFTTARLLPLFVATGALLLSAESHAQESKLSDVFAKRSQQLDYLANGEAAATSTAVSQAPSRGPGRKAPAQHTSGLGTPSLGTSSLQGNTSLNSMARDKTGAGEWRKHFTRKTR